jgi:hypothetical protein
MHKFRSLFLLILVFAAIPAYSQQVSVNASIDSTMLLIGQQSALHLKVSGPSTLNYTLPQFPGDTLVNGIEVLARGPIDTVNQKNGEIQLKVDYLITSFDTGLYYISPIKVLAGIDTVESNNMALKVLTYEVDTTNVNLFDIKGAQAPPFVLSDYFVSIAIFLLAYILVLFAIWLILKKKYGLKTGETEPVQVYLLPHVRAIMDLDRLKAEKPWKSGKNKEYYTRLTDIIRTYIENRFQINAMEMTTAEILPLFSKDKNTQSVFQNLRQILQLSDLVKFAKQVPLENENEMSIMNAYLFVNQTKIEEVQTVEEQKEAYMEQKETEDSTSVPKVEENDYLKKFQRK